MAKFKVGDTVINPRGEIGVVVKIHRKGGFKLNMISSHKYGVDSDGLVPVGDSVFKLYFKKITDTTIARKLYSGKIEKEKDGYLWVKG